MPVYNFICTKCCTPFRKLYTPDDFKMKQTSTACPQCGYYAAHLGGAPSTQSMEVLDDGIRPIRMERYADAERLFSEREVAHDQKYGNKEPDNDE